MQVKDPSTKMPVWVLDLQTKTWHTLPVEGQVPSIRGGHSATLIGHSLYIFGGEDCGRRALADLYCLDLYSNTWRQLLGPKPAKGRPQPAARSAHTAVNWQDQSLLIFGGAWPLTAWSFNDDI